MKEYTKINCIACNKELDNWEYEGRGGVMVEVHPMRGLHFRTQGHYGSSIFDPMAEPLSLDVAICDLCVMKNLDKVRGTGKKELLDNVNILVDDILVDAAERRG
jgi:hypothetical protein